MSMNLTKHYKTKLSELPKNGGIVWFVKAHSSHIIILMFFAIENLNCLSCVILSVKFFAEHIMRILLEATRPTVLISWTRRKFLKTSWQLQSKKYRQKWLCYVGNDFTLSFHQYDHTTIQYGHTTIHQYDHNFNLSSEYNSRCIDTCSVVFRW